MTGFGGEFQSQVNLIFMHEAIMWMQNKVMFKSAFFLNSS